MILLLLGLFLGLPFLILILSPLLRHQLGAAGRIYLIHSSRPIDLETSSISRRRIAEFLDLAEEQGIRFVTTADALSDHGAAALTADDGYSDLLELWPVLRERHIPLTVFIPTAFIGQTNSWDHPLAAGKRKHLTAEEIRLLAEEGVLFGSHGHSHCDLTTLKQVEIERELRTSKEILEEITGGSINMLAYPFGKSDYRVREIGRVLGYSHAFLSAPTGSTAFSQGRIPITGLDNSFSLQAKLRTNLLSGAEYLKVLTVASFSHLAPALEALKRNCKRPIDTH
jgi:peptidoglycan/xylan/chitin deacetylase (PgdA/CDA1 family)